MIVTKLFVVELVEYPCIFVIFDLFSVKCGRFSVSIFLVNLVAFSVLKYGKSL